MTEQSKGMHRQRHRYVRDRLSAYVDGELNENEKTRIEEHLAACEVCRADLHTLRWTKRLLRETPPVKIPRSFVVREADVRSRPRLSRRVQLYATQWATAVVALLLVVVAGGDLLTGAGMRLAQSTEAPMRAVQEPTTTVAMAVVDEGSAPQQPTPESEKAHRAPEATLTLTLPEITVVTQEKEVVLEAERVGAAPADTVTVTAETVVQAPRGVSSATATLEPKAFALPSEADRAAVTPLPIPPKHENVLTPEERESPQEETEPGKALSPPLGTATAEPTPIPGGRLAASNARLAWRVAEVTLGLALAGLLLAVLWMRRRG